MDNRVLFGGAFLIVAYVLYIMFRKKDDAFVREYNDILNSTKYKVKGQWDK